MATRPLLTGNGGTPRFSSIFLFWNHGVRPITVRQIFDVKELTGKIQSPNDLLSILGTLEPGVKVEKSSPRATQSAQI